jgi:hypothetical protein
MNANIAVVAMSTRCGPTAPTLDLDFIITSLALDPYDLMTLFSQPGCQAFFTGRPPRSFDRHEHQGTRTERPPESLFPVSRIHDFRRHSKRAPVSQISDSARQVSGIDCRLVQGNSVWDNVDVNESQPHIQSLGKRGGVLQRSSRQFRFSMWNNNLKVRGAYDWSRNLPDLPCQLFLHTWSG